MKISKSKQSKLVHKRGNSSYELRFRPRFLYRLAESPIWTLHHHQFHLCPFRREIIRRGL